ncbi:pseudouridine synthase [Lysobacter enzymogenes]|uniref:pseudouridine synthase n=1 Tax=Lysobacter enzymogenes TaxID=69 RepID=UPI000944A28A|nr:pseudouridine synthase [Lysobacter enzymogenes]
MPGPALNKTPPRHGLARVLSKQGVCSRSEAARWIAQGRVSVDGRIVRDPEFAIVQGRQRIRVDGADLGDARRFYLMLNKPRGLVTTAADERGRDTVYRCLDGAELDGAPLPWLAPVGRLDKASEGLLLFCNDPQWAARITDPELGPDKTYRVQVDAIPDEAQLRALEAGVDDDGERLRAKSVRLLRSGEKNAWLEIVLDEGRNRQIRRLLAAFGLETLRLVRVAIGELPLGELPKGQWRVLDEDDLRKLR